MIRGSIQRITQVGTFSARSVRCRVSFIEMSSIREKLSSTTGSNCSPSAVSVRPFACRLNNGKP